MEQLAAEPVDRPQDQAEDDAKQNRGRDRKRDRPPTTAPGEVAGKTAEREIQTAEAKNHEAGDDQQQAKEEERATKIRHGEGRRSGSCKQCCGFAEKLCRLAGLGEDANGAGQFVRVLADAFEVGVKPGEHDDFAGWLFFRNVGQESETVSVRHRDIAEKEMGLKLASACEPLICGVSGPRFKAALVEHKSERIGDQAIIVNDQNARHLDLLENRFERREH
jgi:hypothetical protein